MAKDKDGNEIPGSEPTPGQEPTPNGDDEVKKQLAELVAANKKLMADNEVQREELQRTQAMLRSFTESGGGDPNGNGGGDSRTPRGKGRFADPGYRSEFERKYSLPADAAEEIVQESTSRFLEIQAERDNAMRQAEGLKKSFFDANPDLVGYEPIVRHFADEVTREHPNWTVKEGFAECAKRAREYVKSKLNATPGGGEPPPVLPGGGRGGDNRGGAGAGGGGGPAEPERLPTQDEEIAAEMAARRKNRQGAL